MTQFVDIALPVLGIAFPLVFLGLIVVGIVKYHLAILKGVGKFFIAIWTAITKIATWLVNNYTAIKKFIQDKSSKASTWFRLGILFCMTMSVIHGSHLFTNQQNSDVLNLLVAATYDVTTWAMIEGMVKTRKRGYIAASIALLFAIIIVSGLSFFANVAYNQHFYDPTAFTGLGFNIGGFGFNIDGTNSTVKDIVTLAQSSPSLMIILMSLVAELFVKPVVDEEVTRKQRLLKKYMRSVEKKEAKLEAKQKEDEINKQFALIGVKEEVSDNAPVMVQYVKWSLFGILKIYDTPTPAIQTTDTKVLAETIHKISVSMLHLEQNVNTINQYVLPNPQAQNNTIIVNEQKEPLGLLTQHQEEKMIESPKQVATTIVEPIPTPVQPTTTKAKNTKPITPAKTVTPTKATTPTKTTIVEPIPTPVQNVADNRATDTEPLEKIIVTLPQQNIKGSENKENVNSFFSQFSK